MLEKGQTYSFKTLTFYYIGTVTDLYPTHARIVDCIEVFQTGTNDAYYAGKIVESEKIPDGTLVPIGSGIVIMPYNRVKLT